MARMTTRKYIALLVAVALALGVCPGAAFAQGGIVSAQAGTARAVLAYETSDSVHYIRYLDGARTQAVAITARGTQVVNGADRYIHGRVWLVSGGEATELFEGESIYALDELTKLYEVRLTLAEQARRQRPGGGS